LAIERLLGDLPGETFLAEHLFRLPYAGPGSAQGVAPLGNWESLAEILARPQADVLIVRRGRRYEGPPPRDLAQAEALHAQGYTLLVRHAERCHDGLAELAKGFSRDFCAPVDVHLYCTPAGQFGFDWHYDAEDVFIVQTVGRKEYSLRKNTVNPWPLEETLPVDMAYQREIMPLVRCELAAGDWLYIPAGYWHKGESREASISLAIGVMFPAAIDVLDFLRPRLLASLRWRERLPVCGRAQASAGEAEARCSELFARLGADLAALLCDPQLVQDYLAQRRGAFEPERGP
jgi:ribosomal protein L16 Arg81 hydroxylase